MFSCILAIVVWLAALVAPVATTLAGGGPENVLLVVNPRSYSSLTIANHYAHLRGIPAENLLFVPCDPATEVTDVGAFRNEILIPIIRTIEARHLANQIDYVVYSSGFPWGIGLNADVDRFTKEVEREAGEQGAKLPGGEKSKFKWPEWLTAVGSLNGLTYLWQPVILGHPAYFSMHSNGYMRLPQAPEQRDCADDRLSRQPPLRPAWPGRPLPGRIFLALDHARSDVRSGQFAIRGASTTCAVPPRPMGHIRKVRSISSATTTSARRSAMRFFPMPLPT